MELYLDSVDFKEIEEAFQLGSLTGLTTTPTFMHKQGVTDLDATMLRLAEMVPILQVEALGANADEIVKEAHRLIALGLKTDSTVFKIPVSNEGVKACKRLTDEGIMVNIHLVYTLQQAYMAMIAGATYVCPLVGRLQDQGHDALALVKQCVEAVEYYSFGSRIMFSSVRHPEHVRNAINIGVHACTVPWSVMKKLTENNLTQVGTDQFFEHTKLLTMRVEEAIRPENPMVQFGNTILDGVVKMTESGLGAVSVTDEDKSVLGIFTDGDLRRLLKAEGRSVLEKKFGELDFKAPQTIAADSLLFNAVDMFKKQKVDNIIVTEGNTVVGMLDIQDLVKLNVIS
ncbi:MAG: transaldolase family protein [Bacteroidota bacterium]